MSYYGVGGTAIGIKTDKAVVLATDKLYLTGNVAFSQTAKKLFKLTDRVYMATAGLIADAQGLVKEVRYNIGVRTTTYQLEMPVKSIARLVSVILYSSKGLPFYTQVLVGGYLKRPELYSLDSLGSVMADDYVAIGTGAETALSVLDTNYRPDLKKDELIRLVEDAFLTVAQRDVLTGNRIDVVYIGEKKVEEIVLAQSGSMDVVRSRVRGK